MKSWVRTEWVDLTEIWCNIPEHYKALADNSKELLSFIARDLILEPFEMWIYNCAFGDDEDEHDQISLSV